MAHCSFQLVFALLYSNMKVVNITLAQLLQLKFARKTFLVLTTASWLSKSSNETIRSVQLKLGSSAYVLFRLSAEVNSEEEEYIINDLQIKSLPSILYFKHGIIDSINDLSGNSDLSNMRHAALRMEELITYHPRNTQTGLGILSQLAGSENSTGVGRLFISGDRSSVGKSSMCLAILVSLLKRGVHPSALAYIKPVTQCEAEQPITQFCNRVGIANRGIGPIVFYKGFTRAFLHGETSSADILLNEAENAVAEISQGKQFVIVDGVGYPAVGSICNLSNADVAAKLRAPVLLISKSGVGDAVDSYNLNSAYFEHKKVHVLGGIFNKLPQEGYYSLENCREAVTEYFMQFKTSQRPYGFIPVIDTTVNTTNTGNTSNGNDNHMEIVSTSSSSKEDSIVPSLPATAGELLQKEIVHVPVVANTHTFTAFEEVLSAAFLRYVDLDRLLHDVCSK